MYRTVKADNPEKEIMEAAKQIAETGYCWWGCSERQTFCENLLVLENGNSRSGASGLLYTTEISHIDDISEFDLVQNTPDDWINDGELDRFKKFAKVTKAVFQKIPNNRLLHENSGELLDGARWRSNMYVRILEKS
jgi:hypothetical protein